MRQLRNYKRQFLFYDVYEARPRRNKAISAIDRVVRFVRQTKFARLRRVETCNTLQSSAKQTLSVHTSILLLIATHNDREARLFEMSVKLVSCSDKSRLALYIYKLRARNTDICGPTFTAPQLAAVATLYRRIYRQKNNFCKYSETSIQ